MNWTRRYKTTACQHCFFFFSHFKQRNLVFKQVPTLIHQQHSLCFIHTQALLYPKTNFGVSEMKGIPTKLWNATRKQNIADRKRLKLVRNTCRCISIQSVTKKKKGCWNPIDELQAQGILASRLIVRIFFVLFFNELSTGVFVRPTIWTSKLSQVFNLCLLHIPQLNTDMLDWTFHQVGNLFPSSSKNEVT